MHPKEKSVYERYKHEETIDLAQHMLDCWFGQELHDDNVDGIKGLKTILEHWTVGLGFLSRQLVEKNGRLTIGLPKEHTLMEGLQSLPIVTRQAVTVSNQGADPVCAGHAVTKAIVAIIDDWRFDSNEDRIRDQLVYPGVPRDPDHFHGKQISVIYSKQDKSSINGTAKVEIGVHTVPSTVGEDLNFNSAPQIPLPNGVKMVVRWDSCATRYPTKLPCNLCKEIQRGRQNL